MFRYLANQVGRDGDYPARMGEISILRRVLEGRLYDVLPHAFHEERTSGGEYIPLKKRRPSVVYNLCRLVVEDSVALLFSEGHFPAIDCPDHGLRDALTELVWEAGLQRVMTDAAIIGSVGSVAILMRVLSRRVFFVPMATEYLTPTWRAEEPDRLALVRERYKVRRAELEAKGYRLSLDAEWWWFQRDWDASREVWYRPWPVADKEAGPVEDETRTVVHGLGFVPMVWIRNMPGPSSSGDPADGACTFRAAVETQIEIDYQLSQAGRGLKYAADPTLLIKEPAFAEQPSITRSPAEALVVSSGGDAKMLEISGSASGAVIEYVRTLREFALEAVHGNRANADKLSAAQSGRALELMHQPLIWLADHLRQGYGEDGLLQLVLMVLRAGERTAITVDGRPLPRLAPGTGVSLRWPPWFPPTGAERVEEANALTTLRVGGMLSRETAVKAVAATLDVEDVQAEIARIEADDRAILAGTQIPPTGRPQTGAGPNGNQGKGGDTPPPA